MMTESRSTPVAPDIYTTKYGDSYPMCPRCGRRLNTYFIKEKDKWIYPDSCNICHQKIYDNQK